MTRLIGPDEASRLVYRTDGTARAQGLVATVYADSGGSQLADILTLADAAITGSQVSVDAHSMIPLFKFPDGADTVYVSVNGGPVTAAYARTDDRLDALAAAQVTAAAQTMPRSVGARVADLPGTYTVWHRGARLLWPENTTQGFDNAVDAGAKVIKFDVYPMADGGLAVIHDATLDRTTTTTGNVSAQTLATLRTAAVDAGSWFAPVWPSDLRVPTLGDMLRRYGGRVVMFIDPKTTAVTQPILDLVAKFRLQDSVILQSADTTLSDLPKATAAGVKAMFYWNGAPITSPTPAAAIAAGATILGIGKTYSDANIATVVAAGQSAGVVVQGFTVARRWEQARFASLGITSCHSDIPPYTDGATATRTTDNFATGTPDGVIPSDAYVSESFPTYTGSPRRLAFPLTSGGTFALLGYLSPLGASYTISGTVTPDVLDADTSRWVAIALATDDRTFNGQATIFGYNCLIRETGAFQIFRQDPGATANGVTAVGSSNALTPSGTAAAMVAGTPIAWSIQVTPTQLIFTVAGQVITVSDSTYRPLTSVHVGKTGSSTLSASYSGISVA